MNTKSLYLSTFLVLVSLTPARSASFSYDVNFAIASRGVISTVTGTVVTDCNNCALGPSDFLSWSFQIDGGHSISSSGPSPSGILVLGAAPSPLSVTPTQFIYTPSSLQSSIDFEFCSGGGFLCAGDGNGQLVFRAGAQGNLNAIAYQPVADMDSSNLNPYILGTSSVAVPGPLAGAGLPGLVFAGAGFLAWWRRKRTATGALPA